MKAIAAVSINGVIGAKGAIPWYISEDFKWFKKNTLGNIIVMGRKTYESIGKLLPGRETVIITRQPLEVEGATVLQSFEALKNFDAAGRTLWIAGGAEIYKQALPYCTDLLLTLVNKEVEGDTYFPEFEPPFVPLKVLRKEDAFSIIHYTNPEVKAFQQ